MPDHQWVLVGISLLNLAIMGLIGPMIFRLTRMRDNENQRLYTWLQGVEDKLDNHIIWHVGARKEL